MFDAAFSDIGDLPRAKFFGFSIWLKYLARCIISLGDLIYRSLILGVQHKEKRTKFFPRHLEKRHKFTQPRKQSQSLTKKVSDLQTPAFMVISQRHDKLTNIQPDRQLHVCRTYRLKRNAPSTGTEMIDRIEKCHSGLCNPCFLKQNNFLWSQFMILSHSVCRPMLIRSSMIQDVGLSCTQYGTVSYRLYIVIKTKLRWNLARHRIEGRRRSRRILRGNGGIGDVWRCI